MWLTFSIIFFLTSVILFTLLYFSLKRINQYENLIVEFQQIVEFATTKMKAVDSRGHYESDDETGFFFEQLKQLQLTLSGVFENEKLQESDNG